MTKIIETINFKFNNIKIHFEDFTRTIVTDARPMHFHGKNTLEIHYIIDGDGYCIINNQKYELRKGSFTAIPEYMNHTHVSSDLNKPIKKFHIYLSYDYENEKNLTSSLLKKLYVGKDESLLNYFNLIENELKEKKYGYKQFIFNYLRIIILKILRDSDLNKLIDTNTQGTNITFEIEKSILTEYKTITLKELSKRTFVSERHIQRFLKKNYQKTFNELKLDARMNAACSLLKNTTKSIAEISNEIGYSSTEHFSASFKNKFNITPREYRKNKKTLNEID